MNAADTVCDREQLTHCTEVTNSACQVQSRTQSWPSAAMASESHGIASISLTGRLASSSGSRRRTAAGPEPFTPPFAPLFTLLEAEAAQRED